MNLSTSLLKKSEWQDYEFSSHKNLFGENYLDTFRDYGFVVLVSTEDKEHFCYATIKELDRETVYMNFGGMFEKFRKSGNGYRGFHEIVECLKRQYKRIGFTCRTKNIPMIKLGLNEGFEIVGLRKVYGFPSVEFLLERGS